MSIAAGENAVENLGVDVFRRKFVEVINGVQGDEK